MKMDTVLGSEDLKKLQMFTSKLETRKHLQGISFKNDGGFLEMVATDGQGLFRIRRKLGKGETMEEGLQVVLKLPKFKKGNCTIREESGKYILHNNGEEGLCQLIELPFPRYDVLINDMKGLPPASEFALFSAENMKRLEAVLGNFVPAPPTAKNHRGPHYFNNDKYNGTSELIVLMPKIS